MTLLEKMPAAETQDAWDLQQKDSPAKSILIVEDNTEIRNILGWVFQEETIHKVFLAADGETALDMLQITIPQLLLLDYNLPGMNGLELVNHIRSMNAYEHIPVVLMSANIFPEDINDYHLQYIQKPFDLDRLLQLVEEAFAASSLEPGFTNDR